MKTLTLLAMVLAIACVMAIVFSDVSIPAKIGLGAISLAAVLVWVTHRPQQIRAWVPKKH